MNCTTAPSNSQLVEIVVPLGVFAVMVVCTSCLLLMYRQRLQQEWLSMRVNSLKRRSASPALSNGMHQAASEDHNCHLSATAE